jgi:hypothetical protein
VGRREALRLAIVGSGIVAFGARAPWARAAPASATEARFDQLDGVPLCFWRFSKATAGRRVEQQVFASTHLFHARLLGWVADLRVLAASYGGFTGMQRIVTAGLFVDKPGQHGLGQAMDLDEVRWTNGAITPFLHEHESPDPTVRRRYLALDAVCRRHFRYVLDGRYNADHADHLHMDFGGGELVCHTDSRSDTVFVQQVLNEFQGSALDVDGVWGERTQRAFLGSKLRLGVVGDPTRSPLDWRQWLYGTAASGFADVPFTRPPVLPDPLGDVLEPVVGPIQDVLIEVLGQLG